MNIDIFLFIFLSIFHVCVPRLLVSLSGVPTSIQVSVKLLLSPVVRAARVTVL